MANFKRDVNRFLFRNRDKGIPRLMMWICIANAVVYLIGQFRSDLVSLLLFHPQMIMKGQVWRLFTYIFTFASNSVFLFSTFLGALISIMFYYWVGSTLERTWGTLRFNLFYFSGILLTDLVAMILYWCFKLPMTITSDYLNLSMFLAIATLAPETRVLIYMIIPVKMKWLAWLDIGLTAYNMIRYFMLTSYMYPIYGFGWILFCLFPLVALLNYFLFFGKDVKNLFPQLRKFHGKKRKKAASFGYNEEDTRPNPDWAKKYTNDSGAKPYRHKCTVCGRTDVDCPGLEFRYCSKCAGYFCYCIDHINNHTHVQ